VRRHIPLPSYRHAHSYNGGLRIAAPDEVHHLPHVTGPRGTVGHWGLQEDKGKEVEKGREKGTYG